MEPERIRLGHEHHHKGNNLFVAWYGYDISGRPLFAVIPGGTFTNANTFTGRLYTTTGPWFGTTPFNAAQVQSQDVGGATLTFANRDTATFTFTVNGVTQTKAITRQLFASTGISNGGGNTPAKLLLPIGAPTLNNRHSMMVVDLATGVLSALAIDGGISLGCKVGNLRTDGLVRIACTIGGSHWDYNPFANTAVQNTVLAKLPSSAETPVVSAPNGLDYYGVGSNVGGGQVLIRNGNTFTGAIDISTKTSQYVSHILADFTTGKLFTLNDNSSISSNPLRVDRIDIATSRVEASFSEEKRGIDFALYQGEVYVAMYRNSAGKDVVKYNTSTFTKTGEVSVSGVGLGYHAFAIAVDASGVHVGTGTGVQTLSHDLTRTIRTTAFPGGAEISDIFAHGGKLYLNVNLAPVDNVLEIDSATHTILRKWTVAGSPQRPVVVGN